MAVSLHGNNGLITTNGTAAAPSLAAPDNDTGLYFGTNLIHASTDGTERLRIQADGNVAIGTNAVSAGDLATGTTIGLPKLHVDCGHLGNGAYHIARFRAGSDNNNNAAVVTINHSNDRGLAIYGGRSSGDKSWIALRSIDVQGRVSNAIEVIGDQGQGVERISLYTGNATTTTERLRIGDDGQTTITAASGDSILHIKRSDTNTTGLTGGINFVASDDHSVANIQAIGDGDNEGAHIVFKTTSAAAGDIFNAATLERLRIKSDGGILQTKTGANVNLTLSRNESVGTDDTAVAVIDFANNTAHTVNSRIMAKTAGTSNVGGDLVVETRADGGSLTEKFRITGAGKVGINDTTPDATLSVGGATAFIDVGAAGGNRGKIGYNSNSLYFGTSSGSGEFIFSNTLNSNENPSHSSGVERFRINSAGHVTVSAASYSALTINTTNDGTNGPEIQLMHTSTSPAANDVVGQLRYSGKDSAGNTTLYSKIETIVEDPTNAQETAYINFSTRGYSSFNPILRLKNRGTASSPSYSTDDHNGLIIDVHNTGSPYPRYINLIAKSAGNTASNIDFWTEKVGGSPERKLRISDVGKVTVWSDAEPQVDVQATSAAGASMRVQSAGAYAYHMAVSTNFHWRWGMPTGTTSFTLRDSTNNRDRFWVDSSNGSYHKGVNHTNLEVRSGDASTKAIIQTVQGSDIRIGASTNHRLDLYSGGLAKVTINTRGKLQINSHADTAVYGASNWARTGTGNQSNASQSSPEGSFQFQSNTGNGTMRYKSYIQATTANQTEMYIHLTNSGYYRITIEASHNSQSANVAMYLVYGLNNMSARIQEVTSSGNFSATTQNTHVNSHDTTLKISYSGATNQGMRALVEQIGGF